jgi:hypothetical protein
MKLILAVGIVLFPHQWHAEFRALRLKEFLNYLPIISQDGNWRSAIDGGSA